MDSPTSPTPAVAPLADDAPQGALARLGRLLPSVDALVRFAYRTAAASAVAAVLVVAALVYTVGGGASRETPWIVVGGLLLVLWIPAGGAALAGWTLADLARLPGHLREAALAAGQRAKRAEAERGKSRLAASARALWATRSLALASRGAWLRAVGAVRFVRLASLPFALALGVLFVLNVIVVLAGAVALFVLVL